MCPSPSTEDSTSGPSGASQQAKHCLPNSAFLITDQGGDPDAGDFGGCVRHRWRVLYYAQRHAAGLPLSKGVADFERLMAEVLAQLSRGFEPIAPLRLAPPQDPLLDRCTERSSKQRATFSGRLTWTGGAGTIEGYAQPPGGNTLRIRPPAVGLLSLKGALYAVSIL
jgi:hypothetical protein